MLEDLKKERERYREIRIVLLIKWNDFVLKNYRSWLVNGFVCGHADWRKRKFIKFDSSTINIYLRNFYVSFKIPTLIS